MLRTSFALEGPPVRKFAMLMPFLLLVGGCVATTGSGRTQIVAPQPVSAFYSEANLQRSVLLAGSPVCQEACASAAAFGRHVARIGRRLAAAADPEAVQPGLRFDVRVLENADIGAASSAAGNVVLFGGLRPLDLDEPALAFIVAREMGHVLSRHHEEDSATSLIFSIIGSLVLPVGNLLRGAAAVVTASEGVNVATTAASVAGAAAYKASYRTDQLREADLVALQLMTTAGWRVEEVAQALAAAAARLNDAGWSGELLASKARLDHLTAGPPWLGLDGGTQTAQTTGAAPVTTAAVQPAVPITPSTTFTLSP